VIWGSVAVDVKPNMFAYAPFKEQQSNGRDSSDQKEEKNDRVPMFWKL
jgi:hypothetical protein